MDKKKKIGIFAAIVAAVGYWYYNSRNTLISAVQIVPTGLSTGGNLLNPTLTVNLNAVNPSTGTATIKSIQANILYNGSTIGTVNMQTPFTIAPNNTTPFSLPVSISDLSALGAIYQILIVGNPVQFELVGTALIDIFTLPFDIVYTP